MSRFRSRPSEIEAVQWAGDNEAQMKAFASGRTRKEYTGDGLWHLELMAGKDGESGWIPIPVMNWVACSAGDHSDYWPIEPDYFASKYEKI